MVIVVMVIVVVIVIVVMVIGVMVVIVIVLMVVIAIVVIVIVVIVIISVVMISKRKGKKPPQNHHERDGDNRCYCRGDNYKNRCYLGFPLLVCVPSAHAVKTSQSFLGGR